MSSSSSSASPQTDVDAARVRTASEEQAGLLDTARVDPLCERPEYKGEVRMVFGYGSLLWKPPEIYDESLR